MASEHEYYCDVCETKFTIFHESEYDTVDYCPFCSTELTISESDINDEELK